MMTKQSLLFYSFAETAYSHCRKKCEEYCSYVIRTINSMIEFKQIIGRGTRLFDGKGYFTMHDFVSAYKNFSYPQWDSEPIELIELPELPAKHRLSS